MESVTPNISSYRLQTAKLRKLQMPHQIFTSSGWVSYWCGVWSPSRLQLHDVALQMKEENETCYDKTDVHPRSMLTLTLDYTVPVWRTRASVHCRKTAVGYAQSTGSHCYNRTPTLLTKLRIRIAKDHTTLKTTTPFSDLLQLHKWAWHDYWHK